MANGTLGQLLVSIGIDPSGLSTGAGQVESALESLGTRLFFLGSRIGAAFSVPLAGAVAAIEHYGSAFDQAMTESLAIMDHVTPEMREKMEEQARVVSETTKFSSTEAAKAYYDLASAGLNAADAVAALPIVAKFAQAGLMDLAHAGEWLTGAQAALGLKTSSTAQNLYEMTRISDVLTTVNNKSIGTVKDYAQALTNQGAVAIRTYGLSLEQGVAILGVFGQQHILGNRAGTLLNMTLRDLTAAAIKHKDAFAQAGIAVFDANGNLRNMADISDDLTKKLGPMTTEGRRAELMYLGLTSRSMQGTLALIGMGDQLRSLEHDLHNAGGATEEVAQKQMLSFNNQMLVLGHQFENVAIQIFASFVPAFQDYVVPLIDRALNLARDLATYFDSLSESTKGVILGLVGIGIAIAPVMVAISGLFLVGRVVATVVDLTTSLTTLAVAAETAAAATGAVAGETTVMTTIGAELTAIFTGTIAVFAGWVLVIGGTIYAVKEMVGGWERLFDLLNVATGGVLYILVDALRSVWNMLASYGPMMSDIYEFISAHLIMGFHNLKDLLNDLATDGATMIKRWNEIKGAFYDAANSLTNVSSGLAKLNDYMRDHLPLVQKVEDWIGNKLNTAIEGVTNWYHKMVQEAKDYNEALTIQLPNIKTNTDAYWRMSEAMQDVHKWILKNQPAQAPALSPIPGMSMQQYMDKMFPQGKGTSADVKPSKRTVGIFDEINGTKALQDARDWMAAIDQIGGASQVAESDINRGIKIFDSAIDRLEKMGKGGTAAAQAMYDMRDSLFWASDAAIKLVAQLDKIELRGKTTGQMTASNMGLGFETPNTMGLTEYMKTQKELEKVEQGGKVTSQIGPSMFPGFIPASAIQRSLQMTSILPGLSKGFQDLGRSIGGTTGTMITGLGHAFSTMNDGQKSTEQLGLNGQKLGGSFGFLSTAFNENATTAQRTQAAMMAVTAVVGGAKAVWDATASAATGMGNALAGAMKGAEAGAAFGPWGMAIGAAAGFMVGIIRGKPEWAKAADEIANDFGVKISDKLAKTIADEAGKFGGSSQASAISHLSDIIKEAGGLANTNLPQMEDRLHDVFSMIETHHMTIAQGAKTLDDNWATFVKAGTDAYGFIDSKLTDMIKLNQQFGTDSKAITDYLKAQTSEVAAGFNLIATGGMKPLNDQFDALNQAGTNLTGGMTPGKTDTSDSKYVVGLLQQIEDAQARIQTIKDKGAKATASDLQSMKDLQAKLPLLQADYDKLSDAQKQAGTDLQKSLQGGQDEFDRLGRLAQLAFGASIASGKTFLESLDAIGPGLDQMSKAADNFGYTQSAAFSQLIGIRNFTNANKDLVGELDGVNKMIVGLANSGYLTQASFTDLGAEANSVFDRMKRQGMDGDTALLMMKPTLQTLWEAQQKFGYKVDDATQALLDQAVKSGIVGEDSKSDSAKMVDGIDKLNKTLKDLVLALTGGVGGAFDALATKSKTVTDGITTNINNIPRSINIDVNTTTRSGNREDDTPRMASGGILTGPRRVLAGEAGTEAIIPLTRLKDFLQPQNGSSSGGSAPDVVVQIDGREIARASLTYMPDELRRNGIFT